MDLTKGARYLILGMAAFVIGCSSSDYAVRTDPVNIPVASSQPEKKDAFGEFKRKDDSGLVAFDYLDDVLGMDIVGSGGFDPYAQYNRKVNSGTDMTVEELEKFLPENLIRFGMEIGDIYESLRKDPHGFSLFGVPVGYKLDFRKKRFNLYFPGNIEARVNTSGDVRAKKEFKF